MTETNGRQDKLDAIAREHLDDRYLDAASGRVSSCCPIEINAAGDGPETDPALVDQTVCMDHHDEPWPCQYDSTGWSWEVRTGKHDDGRPWQEWRVYLRDEAVFWSPSLDLVKQGIRDYQRSGHV